MAPQNFCAQPHSRILLSSASMEACSRRGGAGVSECKQLRLAVEGVAGGCHRSALAVFSLRHLRPRAVEVLLRKPPVLGGA